VKWATRILLALPFVLAAILNTLVVIARPMHLYSDIWLAIVFFSDSLGLALGSRVVWSDPQQSSQLHSRGSRHSVDSRPALLGVSLANPSFRSIALRTGSMSAIAWFRQLS
jgi:hypothetical protein